MQGEHYRERAVGGGEQQPVGGEECEVAEQEEPAAADPVGGRAEWDGEQQEGGGGAQRQQREPPDRDVEAALQQQVEERVAHRRQPQDRRAAGQPPQLRAAKQPQRRTQPGCLAGRNGTRAVWFRSRAVRSRHEQQQHQHAQRRDARADGEHRVVALGGDPQHQEGQQRTDQGPSGVHRPVHAEGPAALFGRGGQRDHGVPRRRAQALARAVQGQRRADQRHGVREQQGRLAERRETVADRGDGLVPPRAAVGEVAAEQADQKAHAVVDPVQHAEAERGQAESADQVERQYGGDHLGRDVGDQADRAERQHGAGCGGPPPAPGGEARGGWRRGGRGRLRGGVRCGVNYGCRHRIRRSPAAVREIHGQFQMPVMSEPLAEAPA